MTINSPSKSRGRGRGLSSDYSPDERDRLLNGRSESDVLIVNDVNADDDLDGDELAGKRRKADIIRYSSFACAILSWYKSPHMPLPNRISKLTLPFLR
jgi:hypothetical protein